MKKGNTARGGRRKGSGRKKLSKVIRRVYILEDTNSFLTAFGKGYVSHGIDRAAEIVKSLNKEKKVQVSQ